MHLFEKLVAATERGSFLNVFFLLDMLEQPRNTAVILGVICGSPEGCPHD